MEIGCAARLQHVARHLETKNGQNFIQRLFRFAWLCPASLDHRLHQCRRSAYNGKAKAHFACFATVSQGGICHALQAIRPLKMNPANAGGLLGCWLGWVQCDIPLPFHSRSALSPACIASTMASLSLAPPLWLLPLLIAGLSRLLSRTGYSAVYMQPDLYPAGS